MNVSSVYSKSEDSEKYIKFDSDHFSSSENFESNEYSIDDISEKSDNFYENDHGENEKVDGSFEKYFRSFPDENKKCITSLFIGNKNEKKIINANRSGVYLYSYMASGKAKKFLFRKTAYKAYKGLINIDKKGDLIALTSNEIIPGGENKLLIYDICDKYNMKIQTEIQGYSFNIETNGLSVIYLEKKDEENEVEEEYLICACKKYHDGQRNGILLVNIKIDFDDSFFDTVEFEVYCFYPIEEEQVLRFQKLGTEFFLIGGFDKTLGEGKIKLFRLKENKKTKEKKIKFLQDIVVDKYDTQITKFEYNSGKEIIDQNQVKDEQKDSQDEDEIFTGFNGAVSSIIQSKYDSNIIVICNDGKKTLFSKPNLELYEKKFDDNY